MSTSSSISSPEELQSRTCKCGFMARYFTATTLENGGRRFYRCRRLGSNSCGYWNWIDDKLPRHVSTMIHNQKVELDSIRKERNHLKKIVEDMGGIEDPYLKDMIADEMSELKDMNGNEISDLTKVSTLKGKMSNLELPDKIESSNLKKVSSLDDKVLKLELKVHQLISLLAVSWAIIVGFVAAKMM
ncbi:hypothetical protein MTR67_040886 [Solanum verrucosum]|uniref:GRF-type domain-containing protein n=2 Tax=Solanum TaxID=4107 RepID=A0A9J5Y1C2_SOLCO|nr:hypothetical protein H5410_035237 [Solanum commersonii]WMV47501.1 hypothetical protein MTR67_040886 [Solanum verrucosum]